MQLFQNSDQCQVAGIPRRRAFSPSICGCGSSSTGIPLSMATWPPDFRRGMHLELASVLKSARQEDLPIWAASMSKTLNSFPRCSKPLRHVSTLPIAALTALRQVVHGCSRRRIVPPVGVLHALNRHLVGGAAGTSRAEHDIFNKGGCHGHQHSRRYAERSSGQG